jgi:hypothetical protein
MGNMRKLLDSTPEFRHKYAPQVHTGMSVIPDILG